MRPIGSEWAFRILRRNSCPYPWRKKEIFSKNKLAGGIHSHQTGDFFRGFPASVRALKEKPHQIKRVIKASTKASGYIRQNREGTLPVMIKWLKIDRDIASMTYDSVWKAFTEDGSLPENGLRLAIEEAKRIGKVGRDVPFNEVADLSVLREAQKELGIK